MNTASPYPTGTPLKPWGKKEIQTWRQAQSVQRSYKTDVLDRLTALGEDFHQQQYGELRYENNTYPLMMIKTRHWSNDKPMVLITGGVHGYETSGVHGAIDFLESSAKHYSQYVNILTAPCISPWSYETINRWNPSATDPNRSFFQPSPAPECDAVMKMVSEETNKVWAHFDLHETTDTDESQFRPTLAARDGNHFRAQEIPDGFYLVADTQKYDEQFQKSIIEAVKKITHIAPADPKGQIIGVPISQPGVIQYDTENLHLCTGFSQAEFTTTTEVYPDSAMINSSICRQAQVTAINAGLDHLIEHARAKLL